MRGRRQDFPLAKSKGQSLVEVAIFLPILVFILVGIVEVGNLMNTQNRVTTASRAAAGYGATNIDLSSSQVISNTLNNMGLVVLNTVTETLDLSPELWDIWSIYAQTKITGPSPVTITFTVFTDTHVYGNHNVVPMVEWATLVQDVRDDIRQAITEECNVNPNCTGDIKVVASVPFYNLDTILGLPIWQWTGFRTVRGLTVMRIGERTLNTGCPLIPIAVHLEQYSLYPSDWTCGAGDGPPCDITLWRGPWNAGTPWFNQDPVYKFPSNFNSNPPPLPYTNNITNTLVLSTTNYKDNVPGVPLQMAQGSSGNIYTATLGTGPGTFTWLTWDGSSPNLAYPPGDFSAKYPGSFSDSTLGNSNGILEIGEEVQGGSAIDLGGLNNFINEYKPAIIVTDDTSPPYQVYSFANVEIIGYNSNENWFLFKIVRWPSEQCIANSEYPPAYVGP